MDDFDGVFDSGVWNLPWIFVVFDFGFFWFDQMILQHFARSFWFWSWKPPETGLWTFFKKISSRLVSISSFFLLSIVFVACIRFFLCGKWFFFKGEGIFFQCLGWKHALDRSARLCMMIKKQRRDTETETQADRQTVEADLCKTINSDHHLSNKIGMVQYARIWTI